MLPPRLLKPPDGTPPGCAFRLAGLADGTALRRSCFPHYTQSQFDDMFRRLVRWQEQERAFILLAELTEPPKATISLIGSGQLIQQATTAEIANVYVVADHHRRGVGTALITILTQIARHLKLPAVDIGVLAENLPALTLYKKLGFREIGRLQTDPANLSIILRKPL